MVDFARLSRAALEAMEAHGVVLRDAERALAASGSSVLAAVLGGAEAVFEWQHYPPGDVYDSATHAQFFYHAHPSGERPSRRTGAKGEEPAEHGHFHTFLRAAGMPAGVRPLVLPELAIAENPAAPKAALEPSAPEAAGGEDADPWTHLVAIAMDGRGRPLRFFTTNRWVTGETWYAAADVAAMLERFAIGPAPASLVGRWLTALIGLHRPNLAELLAQRDAAVMDWRRRRRAKVHVLEDRRLEITASLVIDVERQIDHVAAALRRVA